ncbi:hypothetical protein TA3x_003107 [Tundrisphaera sp. TA3]|uniref:hypothetical protein n=1 Tax=Tundrisphaera sp. TA3 TaxID=3435775 RepID=UPI003EB8335D
MLERPLTIAGLMGLVALMAAGVASLRDHPDGLATFATGLAFALNLAAMLAAATGRGRIRAIAGAYVACGLSYLFLVTFVEPVDSLVFSRGVVPSFALMERWMGRFSSGPPYRLVPHATVVHASFAISAGLAGGAFARALASRQAVSARTTNTAGHP